MTLPPWCILCDVCKCRYSLRPICPVCEEIAAWKAINRRDWWLISYLLALFGLLITAVVVSLLLTRS